MKTIFYSVLFLGLFNSSPTHNIQNISEVEVTFKIKNLGISVGGKFTDVIFESDFNKDDLDNSFINATIKVNSLDTDNKKRDEHLMKADFFNVEVFPSIKFSSTKIERLQDNSYSLIGDLTIKNTTKLVTIPVLINNTTLNASFTLNRKDYGVGGNSWIMSNKVKIEVSLVLH
ncbi:MAG: YceI family protein [Chlorobi bacterium]|nr:YceI family protein [Chlorobiota bacterium]